MKIKTKDKIVRSVLKKMDQRSLVGQEKYGSTMCRELFEGRKDLHAFLVDVQEEIMDALLYIEAAKSALQDEVEEMLLKVCREVDIDDPIPDIPLVDPRGYSLSYYPEPQTCTLDDCCGGAIDECKFEISQ